MARVKNRGVTPQSEDFSAWYNELVVQAELADRGPVRGTMVLRPYGYRIWELLQSELDRRIKATGHENAYFPLFIPESHLRKEAEHVEGFAPELAVVTYAGGKKLDEPLVVRPTSETIVGEMFSRWIDSYRDLPLLINQWANVVRWELRPRVFLRTTEFLWQEGHTAHSNEQDAIEETLVAVGFYEELARDVAAIPVRIGDKTPGERFAGARRTVSLEALTADGRALQAATSHYLGTNFSAAFDISYSSADGDRRLCHTTSWGMSTRMIGGIIMCHGDDQGLILPPKLAPYEVVIVPIGKDDELADVLATARALRDEIAEQAIRVRLDDREQLSPGYKFNHWELRGVPLRLELGPRDLRAGSVTIVDRLGGERESVSLESIAGELSDRLVTFQAALLQRATRFRDEHTTRVDTYEELVDAVGRGFAVALICEDPTCEEKIKAETTATARVVPIDEIDESGPCIVCARPAAYGRRVLFARAY